MFHRANAHAFVRLCILIRLMKSLRIIMARQKKKHDNAAAARAVYEAPATWAWPMTREAYLLAGTNDSASAATSAGGTQTGDNGASGGTKKPPENNGAKPYWYPSDGWPTDTFDPWNTWDD